MSNELSTFLNSGDIEAFFALAQEMGIDVDSSPSISDGGGRFTSFSIPKGCRFSVTYFDTGKFEWNAPNEPAEIKETFYKIVEGEPIDVSDFNVLKGYIVGAGFELQSRLSTYVGDKTKVTCSCIGYKINDEYVKALPPVPIKSMHAWVGDQISHTTPDPLVEKFGLVGSRGETCSQCIRNGHSTMTVVDEKGNSKIESCTPRGVLYMVVTEAGKSTMKAGKKGEDPQKIVKTYSISDLSDDEGNPKKPFLLAINITGLGIRGAWNNEPRIIGLFHHMSGLEKQFSSGDPRRNPMFHLTTISLEKKTGGIKFQPAFGIEPASLKDMKMACSIWDEHVPNREVATIDPSFISGFTGTDEDKFSASSMLDAQASEDDFEL